MVMPTHIVAVGGIVEDGIGNILLVKTRNGGWVTPVRDQGEKGYCWVFGTCGALESALLKATGLEFDISENNIGNLMLKYSKLGDINLDESGFEYLAVAFLLDWLGASGILGVALM